MDCMPVSLYPGILLHPICVHDEETVSFHWPLMTDGLIIHYCLSGRMGWNLPEGNPVYLGPGDFFLAGQEDLSRAAVSAPNGDYEGIALQIDRKALGETPPEPLVGSGITGESLMGKFCPGGRSAAFAADSQTAQIFESLGRAAGEFGLTLQKIKVLELLLALRTTDGCREKRLTEYQSEQVEIIRQIHDRLTGNLSERCSIEELSRQYLMNPTTLKQMFKTIYGTSIAAHIREHRMEAAARLLAQTDMSIADIAQKVGYDSQSRFSTAFKEHYGMLPKEYRRKCASQEIKLDTSTLD